MLTTTPHLYIRRPSPTTAEFTVTTCPPLTLPLRLLLLTLHLVRMLLVATALLTLYARFIFLPALLLTTTNNNDPTTTTTTQKPKAAENPEFLLLPPFVTGNNLLPTALTTLLTTAHLSRPGLALTRLVVAGGQGLPDWAVALGVLGAIYTAVCLLQLHTTESVLVLRGLGIQTSSCSSFSRFWWGAATQTRFIPTEKIRDVLINEAFRGFGVRYYLIVVVEGEGDVVVLFPGLLPRRRIVEAVWRGVRGCLFEGEEGGGEGDGDGDGDGGGGGKG
ncbi:GPI-c transferase complex [Chaetomidium leptoderma]|uniref:GPI-c transferase complex n=1 Tax=Chaetomidium leptoderma TaxID=669021 RepID=A0AAN6VQ10_9PEZI|nr:GPI-c transferase complex [Chaetomidium leptoderma]